jgi:hypothetical protein
VHLMFVSQSAPQNVPFGSGSVYKRLMDFEKFAKVARSEGFEPPALGIEIRCSIQLSYERVSLFNALAGNSIP